METKCIFCNSKLNPRNKSGYCTKCYTKSPPFLKYQKEYQKKLYYSSDGKRKKWIKDFKTKNKSKIKVYQRKYREEHLDKIKEQKKAWEIKHGYRKG